MKVKLILVLLLLFNLTKLNSCGPGFWKQAVEEYQQGGEYNTVPYEQGVNKEILLREIAQLKQERRQLEQNFDKMNEFMIEIMNNPTLNLSREVLLRIGKFVRAFPLQFPSVK